MLHRAAKVIQDVYYIVLRKSFMHRIEKVDRIDEETMFIHAASPGIDGKNFRVPGAPPGSLSSDQTEELAALTSYGCTNAIATMGPSLQIMLKDFILEASLVALIRKLWAVLIHRDGAVEDKRDIVELHDVFFLIGYHPWVPQIEQERYALDLTHAQHGHQNETLMPWGTYVETRTRESGGMYPIGRARQNSKKMMTERFGQPGSNFQIIAEHFSDATTAAIREFSGWTTLWKERDNTVYRRKVRNLLQHVTTRLDEFIAIKTGDDLYKLCESSTDMKLMQSVAKDIRKKKHESWGPDLRGPAFHEALKLVKARQMAERER
ncbi:MAG: hypothetical protein Q9216_003777 [Gyalolechia sp. 2 TL-2023]